MDIINKKFFSSTNTPVIEQSEYDKVEILKETCEALSRMCNESIYIIDYSKQEFFFVSSHPLFLCGYTSEEVLEMGYDFFEKVFSSEDLERTLEMNRLGWQLFYEATPEERINVLVSDDVYLHHKNGTKILANYKISPIRLTKEGNIWLALCVFNYSPNKKTNNIVFTIKDRMEYYTYDSNKKQIFRYYPLKLTMREKEISLLIIRGYDTETIAKILKVSPYTIKNHRANIERKLNGSNLFNVATMPYSILV